MAIEVIEPPGVEPLSLDEAKAHLRVDHTVEDELITALITAAREDAESFTRRGFITQDLRLSLDDFPCGGVITLPRPRLQEVLSVKYSDPDGVEQTLVEGTDYQVDTASEPARIAPAPEEEWPETESGRMNAVRIEYRVGYGDAGSNVPGSIRSALRLMIGHLYVNRSAVITGTIVAECPMAVEALLLRHQVPLVV